jgi:Concanavalin A-like lectin/glucanases superfamily
MPLVLFLLALYASQPAGQPRTERWVFDHLDRVGRHPVRVAGHPRLIESPLGKAVQFNGINDALFVGVHPLAGAGQFTWEVIFRPDRGGAREQRFFHLQEQGSSNRMLFEIRVLGEQWYLDSFALSGSASQALLNPSLLHPLGSWFHVAMVYDGHEFRNYVNGVQESAASLHFLPQGPGDSSIGVRMNLRDYFKGAIRESRTTPRALSPDQFLKSPR